MRKFWIMLCALSSMATVFAFTPAQASEWGCKVLLCSADEQGWQSNPSCYPPMLKLIACRSKTFGACGWPSCPSAGTKAPGFQPFGECPTGFTPFAPDRGGDGIGISSQQSMCRKPINDCSGSVVFSRDGCNQTFEIVQRPKRDKPFFWDLRSDSDGSVTRAWFNLKKP